MAQIVIDVEVTTDNGLILIRARKDNRVIESTILKSELTSVNDLASWLLSQTGQKQVIDTALQKRLTIDYHIEIIHDPEIGDIEQIVLDSVAVEPLPADEGKTSFQSLSGWSEWSPDEASDWVMLNVTSFSDARDVLEKVARMLVSLRMIVVD